MGCISPNLMVRTTTRLVLRSQPSLAKSSKSSVSETCDAPLGGRSNERNGTPGIMTQIYHVVHTDLQIKLQLLQCNITCYTNNQTIYTSTPPTSSAPFDDSIGHDTSTPYDQDPRPGVLGPLLSPFPYLTSDVRNDDIVIHLCSCRIQYLENVSISLFSTLSCFVSLMLSFFFFSL